MRKTLLILILILTTNTYAQRYLTFVYPQVDSIIGGVYGTANNYLSVNQNLLFDFYSPYLDTAQKRPLIIYIHGGGFATGTRSYPSVKLLCRKMAMKGYAVANIDYRLDPSFNLYSSSTNRRAMTDAMHDAKQAIRYFKANATFYKLDTNRIFIGGESAGAITSMMASFVDKQSEMTIYPMSNPNNPIGSTSNSTYGNSVKATMCLCGMILDTAAIETNVDPPILWTHGSADTYIPISLSFNVVLRAAHIGLPIQTKLYQGGTHCPWYFGNPNWQTYLDSTINDITTFLYPKVIVGINESNRSNLSFNIYPNPAHNLINMEFDKDYKKVNILLISTLGATVKNCEYLGIKESSIDISGIENGIYFLKIILNGNENITKKIVVNRN